MKFHLRTVLVFIVAVSVVAALASNFFGVIGVEDAFAEIDNAQILIAFMENNDGSWPADWEDLEPHFRSSAFRVGASSNSNVYADEYGFPMWSFEKLKSRIWIDFDANPDVLRRSSKVTLEPKFDVLHSRFLTWRLEDDPNEILWSYFRFEEQK